MELYALKLTLSFQQQLAHLPSSWLVNEVISLSYLFAKQGAKTWHKSITMWMASWGVSHHVDNSTTSKRLFLLHNGILSISWGTK